ncbi:CAAD domain-containing protein [Thermosynechococcaceae cyanobacterium BACA0444]|uniref:CAAD domain-containing protein n=1 Tax=Pseudocalidococcus azoricus BACA0444 TaxID=2918990 RepID=A0AAE4JVP9_9CYAN|nr:CAAD domain-containing protein [Pseudocalidococcus azoricus]MDS3860291.1 CAAD domain-containing protein [Pseudocalidococcus azoricus BACA0444]
MSETYDFHQPSEHQGHEADPSPVDAAPEVSYAEPAPLAIETEPGPIAPIAPEPTPAGMSDEQMQQIREKLYWLLTVFPEQVGNFFGEYKQPLTTAAIVVATIPFVALAVAILEVIETIPLLAPTFELIGFGFSSWFVYRYLLFAKSRKEFVQNIEDYKKQILGSIEPPQS